MSAGVVLLIVVALALIVLVLWTLAIVSICRSERGPSRVAWITVVVVLPVLGSAAWFVRLGGTRSSR